MNELLIYSPLFQSILNIVQDVWKDSTGKIFILTVAGYILGYMIYGGYLSEFSGGRGNSPLGMGEFSLVDLISILPNAIITIVNIIFEAFNKLIRAFVFYVFIPFFIAIAIRMIVGSAIIKGTLVSVTAQGGLLIWLTSIWVWLYWPKFIPSYAFAFIGTLGAILFFGSVPNPGESIAPLPSYPASLLPIIGTLFTLAILFLIIALPCVFGIKIAKTAIGSNSLSKISKLVLNQPIFRPNLLRVSSSPTENQKIKLGQMWFIKQNLPLTIEPEIYEFTPPPDLPYYLVASFKSFILFYVPGKDDHKSQSISIARDLILSMEFENRK